jgi:hypothetical protein
VGSSSNESSIVNGMKASSRPTASCDRQRTSERQTAGDEVMVKYDGRVDFDESRAAGGLGDHEVKSITTIVCCYVNMLHEAEDI